MLDLRYREHAWDNFVNCEVTFFLIVSMDKKLFSMKLIFTCELNTSLLCKEDPPAMAAISLSRKVWWNNYRNGSVTALNRTDIVVLLWMFLLLFSHDWFQTGIFHILANSVIFDESLWWGGWCLVQVFALCLKCSAWRSEHTVQSLFISSVCVDMTMSSRVLLTWVIFIVPISTLPARWVGRENLSKPTSARQHVYCRGLFTQTCRRPLSGSDISLSLSVSPSLFLFTHLARIVFVLHSEGGISCIPNCQECHADPRRWWGDQKRCRCVRVLPLFSRYVFYRLCLSVRATGAPSSCVQRLQCWMNHGVMRVHHTADAPLHGWKMFCTSQAQIFIPAASKSRFIFELWASLTLKEQLSVLRQPLRPITVGLLRDGPWRWRRKHLMLTGFPLVIMDAFWLGDRALTG